MIFLVVTLFALSIALLVYAVAAAMPGQSQVVSQRLADLERVTTGSPFDTLQRRRRQAQRQKLETLLETLGDRMRGDSEKVSAARRLLVQAGYRNQNATAIYFGARLGAALALGALAAVMVPLLGAPAAAVVLGAIWGGMMGYVIPAFYVGRKAKLRKHDIQKALADALDLLVVCVEAGLGLNQALVRVSDEITHVSANMSDELVLTNLEIRAGTPREEALRNLGERTGVEDLRSLVAVLIQTDRFGTSVAQALRVQSETLRVKRRQRAEEAAAKTTIKLVFPLVLFIFPAMFVVILGPAVLQILAALSGFG